MLRITWLEASLMEEVGVWRVNSHKAETTHRVRRRDRSLSHRSSFDRLAVKKCWAHHFEPCNNAYTCTDHERAAVSKPRPQYCSDGRGHKRSTPTTFTLVMPTRLKDLHPREPVARQGKLWNATLHHKGRPRPHLSSMRTDIMTFSSKCPTELRLGTHRC